MGCDVVMVLVRLLGVPMGWVVGRTAGCAMAGGFGSGACGESGFCDACCCFSRECSHLGTECLPVCCHLLCLQSAVKWLEPLHP